MDYKTNLQTKKPIKISQRDFTNPYFFRISARDVDQLLKQLRDLRQERNELILEIKELDQKIQTTPMMDPKRKDLDIDRLYKSEQLEDLLMRIQEGEDREDQIIPGRKQRRSQEQEEIDKWGFTMVFHGENRYNERFTPELNREQVLNLLHKLNLANKIPDITHHIINLAPNFWVAVEDRKVTTFKYDDDYYRNYLKRKGTEPPKYHLDLANIQKLVA